MEYLPLGNLEGMSIDVEETKVLMYQALRLSDISMVQNNNNNNNNTSRHQAS